MSVISYGRENIERFANVLAGYDREQHPGLWVSDETVRAALRGHALCFANAHRVQVVLTHAEIAFGLKVYRRACGLRLPHGGDHRAPTQGRPRHPRPKARF